MYVVMNSERVKELREEHGLSKRAIAAGAWVEDVGGSLNVKPVEK